MLLCQFRILVFLSPPLLRVYAFSTELSSVLFLRRYSLLQERSFKTLPLYFTCDCFFSPVMYIPSLAVLSDLNEALSWFSMSFYEFLISLVELSKLTPKRLV